jgi:DNA polymerase III alpha subunit (gram-positive type)
MIVFDLETGGLDPKIHPVIQFAGIAVDSSWNEVDSLEVKIAFLEGLAEPAALKINSYDREVWAKEAVTSRAACGKIDVFLRRHADVEKSGRWGKYRVASLCGHNAAQFDSPFLQALFGDRFCPAAVYEVLDTLHLARWLSRARGAIVAGSHTLESCCKMFEVPPEDGGAHDALVDVRMTRKLAQILVKRIGGL